MKQQEKFALERTEFEVMKEGNNEKFEMMEEGNNERSVWCTRRK